MMRQVSNWLVVVGILVVPVILGSGLSGCASQAETKVEKKNNAVAPSSPAGSVKIAGQSLMLFTNRQETIQKSLYQILQESGRQVAIVQFAGVQCESCFREAVDLQGKIQNSGQQQVLLHILVMTDLLADFPDESRFLNFRNSYAPSAVLAYDEAVHWKYFSADPKYPNRATILAMNLNMDAVVINQEGQAGRIFDEALKLVVK